MIVKMFDKEYDITSESIAGNRNENQDCVAWMYRCPERTIIANCPDVTEGKGGDELFFAILCDGMGGMNDGGAASGYILSESIKWAVTAEYDTLDEYIASFSENLKKAEGILIDKCPGSGTTMSALMCHRGSWCSLHIGDSRCYSVYSDHIFRTADQSPVEELFKKGVIDETEMNDHPMSNIINFYLGGNHYDKMEVDHLDDGWSSVTLCSDGAFGYMSIEDFHNLIRTDAGAESVVNCALEKGSKDNISALRIIPS